MCFHLRVTTLCNYPTTWWQKSSKIQLELTFPARSSLSNHPCRRSASGTSWGETVWLTETRTATQLWNIIKITHCTTLKHCTSQRRRRKPLDMIEPTGYLRQTWCLMSSSNCGVAGWPLTRGGGSGRRGLALGKLMKRAIESIIKPSSRRHQIIT